MFPQRHTSKVGSFPGPFLPAAAPPAHLDRRILVLCSRGPRPSTRSPRHLRPGRCEPVLWSVTRRLVAAHGCSRPVSNRTGRRSSWRGRDLCPWCRSVTSLRARVVALLRSDRPQVAVGRLEPVVAALDRLGAGVDLLEFEDSRDMQPGQPVGRLGRMTRPDRDRDTEGRARQSRPRDALGRPLPYGAEGVAPVSEEPLPPEDTIQAARELVEGGRPFSAHEVLEARWKAGPVEERDLWQGLAQVCVAMTHAARGNQVGADRLFGRAADRLAAFGSTGRWAYGLELDAIVRQARAHIGGI